MKNRFLYLLLSLFVCIGTMFADITIKVKVPAEWTNNIYVYLYNGTDDAGTNKAWYQTTQDGEWYSFTYTGSDTRINAIIVNNTSPTFNGLAKYNRTGNLNNISADACYEITYSGDANTNSTATATDCPTSGDDPVDPDPQEPESYTFPAGTTIYYDLREYGSGINIYNGKWYADVSNIISVTLTEDWTVTATTALLKSAPNNWSYKTCATLPTDGQNMIVSADGLNLHWDTYVPPVTPVVSFVSPGKTIGVNQDILFSATSDNINGVGQPASSYAFYVKKGTGSYAMVSDGHYQFTEAGTYTVRVRAYDSEKQSQAESEKSVTVLEECSILYYVKKNAWEQVNAHMWGADPETVWPGEVMSLTTATTARNGYPVYSVAYTPAYTNVIFSNDGDSQTTELAINTATPYYYSGAWYASLVECDPPTLETDFFLAGTFNSWSATADRFMKPEIDATEASVTITLAETTGVAFKIVEDGAWCGASATLTEDNNTVVIGAGGTGGNINLTPTIEGEYIFTLNLSTRLLTVTYPTEEEEIPEPSVGVPAEYEGVMLQAFYWNSQSQDESLSIYSDTRYATLLSQTEAIGRNFDLVWMPPSGQGNNVGYYCKSYSNLDGASWGSKSQLMQLIDALHSNNCKVLADIVINHFASSNGWAKAFLENDFGTYGTFQINSTHICSGDEAFTGDESDSRELPSGGTDTGGNDTGCRDLDHANTYVQDMCKAYTQWMINAIGFDGFRYDFTKGYGGQYLALYNMASEPMFSVSEYWENNVGPIKAHLKAAEYNTLAFDFPLKAMFNAWGGSTDYSSLVNPGMRAKGLSRFAVTFIDNHDTFHRSTNKNGEFIGYDTDLSEQKSAILQANAYLLMMPGVPCVFWPHWYTFPEEINALIAVRKLVGIHSESEVTDELAAENSYSATVIGHNGRAILRMGSARDMNLPDGYKRACQGEGFDIYVPSTVTALDNAHSVPAVEKILDNGTIYILKNGVRYTLDGRMAQ